MSIETGTNPGRAAPASRAERRTEGLARFDHMPPDAPVRATRGPMIHGFEIAPDGRTVPLDWPPPERVSGEAWRWVHLDRLHDGVEPWLRDALGLPDQIVEGLLDDGTRPRLVRAADGLLLILRAVNFNPGEPPEAMVSLRLWIGEGGIVSLRRQPVLEALAMRRALERGHGPGTVGTLIADLVEAVTDSADKVVEDVVAEMDALEETVVSEREDGDTRRRLGELRRRLVRLRRHLSPQREALAALVRSAARLDETERLDLSESVEQTQRYVEEIEAAKERAVILGDELATRADERVGRHSFLLSVAAGIFLPITFLTGLLGINVGGMPGEGDPDAFWIVVAICAGMAAVTLGFFLARRWL